MNNLSAVSLTILWLVQLIIPEEKKKHALYQTQLSVSRIRTNGDLLLGIIFSRDMSVFIEYIPIHVTWMASLKTWLGFAS